MKFKTTWPVVNDQPVHEAIPILDVPSGSLEWEAGRKPQVILVAGAPGETYAGRIHRDLHVFGRVLVAVDPGARSPGVAVAHEMMRALVEREEMRPPLLPSMDIPKNRHERRAAAAKARKVGR